MNNMTKGYIFGIIAAVSYGLNPLFALPLYAGGMNPDSVLLFRYLIALPILGVMIKWRRHNFRLKKREVLPHVSLGLLMAASSLTLFLSYTYMAAGIASTLLFVYPVMVAVIMAVCFHEKISPLTVFCILSALWGIALLYQGDGNEHLSLTGVVLIMISALSYAIYMVGVNRPLMRPIPTVRLTFYVLASGSFLFLLRLIAGLSPSLTATGIGAPLILPENGWHWVNLICLAAFPTAVSLICTTRAVFYVGSTVTAILGALEPITAILFGITVFGEQLTMRHVLGIILVIVAVTVIIAGNRVARQILRFRKLFPKGKIHFGK